MAQHDGHLPCHRIDIQRAGPTQIAPARIRSPDVPRRSRKTILHPGSHPPITGYPTRTRTDCQTGSSERQQEELTGR